MPFGEIVIGAPGAGKSTYAYGKHQLFTALERPIAIVNLDPANDDLPYPCDVSIASLITLQDAMNEFGLGPNGGMLYCLEYLEQNLDWLLDKLGALSSDTYIVFDLPGQVELSTNHSSLKNIVNKLVKSGYRVRLHLEPRQSHPFTFLAIQCSQVSRSTPMRRTLCNRRRQIHLYASSLVTGNVATRTAPYQCLVEDRPPVSIRQSWLVCLSLEPAARRTSY